MIQDTAQTVSGDSLEIKAGLIRHALADCRTVVIESTFVHLQGVGEATERRWWETGVLRWSDFFGQTRIPGLSAGRKHYYDSALHRAAEALLQHDTAYFASCLRPRDQWRLLPVCRPDAVYLDIETTGEDASPESLTVVGLHRNGCTLQLVAHENLSERSLHEAFDGATMLITFFGSVFDVPFLRRAYPRLRVPPLHVDLCFAARRIGLHGGLKSVEHQVGLARADDLMGLSGWDAVVLWHEHRQGNSRAIKRLLEYNKADTEHLVPLAEHIYEGLARGLGPPVFSLQV